MSANTISILNPMNKFDKTCIKERIIRLVKLKSTGTPSELAQRFEISERSVKRLIRELKQEGEVKKFDHNRMSYVGFEI
jgi:ribosomal protein S25